MRSAVVSHNARRFDAIGNHIAEKVTFFEERQAEVRVFVESAQALHFQLRDVCHIIDQSQSGEALNYLKSCDLVFFEFGQGYESLNWLPYLAGKKPRLIFDYHCVTPPAMWPDRHRREMERAGRLRKLAWCADAVWVHSRFAQRELKAATGLPEHMIHCIGFPVAAITGSSDATKRNVDGKRTVLFVGRLAPNKRVPVLIEALAELSDQTPSIHAVVIGDDTDVYADEKKKCVRLAQSLTVSDRIEFRGQASADELQRAYQAADVFVMPSQHEGFCIPAVEAMANGVPVIAARAAALPETVGDAGLTFTPDDASDLAQSIRRVLDANESREPPTQSQGKKRIAVVACRFGDNVVGGAETSLRSMASALQRNGHSVAVFSTCAASDSDWQNDLPAGHSTIHGLDVQRFPIDDHNRTAHLDSVQKIKRSDGPIASNIADEYLRHSLHSSALIEHLGSRIDEFDAIIAGPYLFGLTADVARAFPGKTLVAPCFHDEPFAYLPCWPALYASVGGILFHSECEKQFAQSILGVNHPNAHVLGAFLETGEKPPSGSRPVDGPYLAYCGRYSPEKELPRLIEYARHFEGLWPGRFRFVFMGNGSVAIPKEPWAVDLGFVHEQRKHEVLADACALIQLSCNESLSLVALEAWREGTPVVADSRCEVLADFIDQSHGGATATDFDGFADLLHSIWTNPDDWKSRGERGRDFVRKKFGSDRRYTETLVAAIDGLTQPIAELMRRRGMARAALFGRAQWDARIASLTEATLERTPRCVRNNIVIEPQRTRITAGPGQSLLVSLRVSNQGTHTLIGEGPGGTNLQVSVAAAVSGSTPLPGVLAPGEAAVVAVPVTMPDLIGDYELRFCAIHDGKPIPEAASIGLTVADGNDIADDAFCRPFLDDIEEALVELHRKQELPTGYLDVSGGWLANWKQRVKQKLLNNFKQAYVDVLSRQQTEVNQQTMTAMQRMAECCESLQNAVVALERRVRELEGREFVTAEVAEERRDSYGLP